jgi:hypothetical protein
MRRVINMLAGRRGVGRTQLVAGGERFGVLSSGDSATLSYLIEPHLASLGRSHDLIDATSRTDVAEALCFHTVIIVRYLPTHWLQPLRAFRAMGGQIVYFMDDDLMDEAAVAGLPKAYARKIRLLATRQRANIEALCDEFWVGTPHLAEKYGTWNPTVLPLLASGPDLAHTPLVTFFYHGTASHRAELEWLPQIVDSVQSAGPQTMFEVFGDHSVNKMFKGFPRTAVLHPMSWPSYLAYTASVRRDIGLAPLLPGAFNAARGPTKFFDFARMGAVGIYSDIAPYRGFIRPEVDGLLLPNEPALWVKAIAELVADPERRMRMATAARERALTLASTPSRAAARAG